MTEKKATQDFAAVLMSHAKGRAHTEASSEMQRVIAAVRETGKSGSITIKLSFNSDKDNPDLIKVADSIKAVVPVEARRSVWFSDDDNSLHRNDPRQGSLFEGEAEVERTPNPNAKS